MAGSPDQKHPVSPRSLGVDPGTGYAHLLTETSDGYSSEQRTTPDRRVRDAHGYDVDLDTGRLIVGAPYNPGRRAACLYPLPSGDSVERFV